MNQKKGITAIIKPTHYCNLGCKYCYVDENAENGMMDDQTLRNSLEKVIDYNRKQCKASYFIWHGGEPLLMGVDFFRKVNEIENRYRPENIITNSIQTNGTLISDDILEFCQQTKDFHLSLSLDGPKDLHNAMRPYKDGKGSFEDVLRNIKLMQNARGKKCIGVIVILTRNNRLRIGDLYDFFRENEISFKINPLTRSGKAIANYQELALSPEEYGEAMIRLFDMWFYEKEYRISIDPFDRVIANIVTGIPLGCNFSVSCQKSFISIGPRGDVYPCGRFDGTREFKLGNINDENIETILTSGLREKLTSRGAETIGECAACSYKNVCNAGCMHNSYAATGDVMGKDYYCAGYRLMFAHITQAIQKEIQKESLGGRYANKSAARNH